MLVKIKSEKKQNIQAILDKLKQIEVYEDGAIDFLFSFEYEHAMWMLLSILEFKNNLAPSTRKKIIVASFNELLKNRVFERDKLFELIDKNLKSHLRKKQKTFFLLGSLSIKNVPFRRVNIGDCKAKIYKNSFPKPFENQRSEFLDKNHFNCDIPDYTKVIIELKSKNIEDAFVEGIEKFEVLRSFLCLITNKATEIRYNDRDSKPINLIGAGEVFTLHDVNGECPSKMCWTTDNYQKTTIYDLTAGKKNELRKKMIKILGNFNSLLKEDQNIIQKALNVYVSAFDEKDKHLCLLKAWTVLEILLKTDQNDELIKRVVNIYHDKDKYLIKQDLECLREYRNEFVHSGNHHIDALTPCFRLQKYIRVVINYHLKLSTKFKNLSESIDFLDTYGLQRKDLMKRKKLIEKALKIKSTNS